MSAITGVYPEAHELLEDAPQRTVTVRNRFYAITHSLDHGGAIIAVRYLLGSDRNLLLGDCAGEVALAGGGTYSERHDAQTKLTVTRDGDDLQLVFEGVLRDGEGNDCGIAYRHTYLHRWGHVRVDKRLSFPQEVRVSRVCVHSWTLQPELCHHVLAVMIIAGLYESSGDWFYRVGLPGKSGIGGGIVTVSPGKAGLGSYSPPLDAAGNSVRGQLSARYLSQRLGLDLLTSAPAR